MEALTVDGQVPNHSRTIVLNLREGALSQVNEGLVELAVIQRHDLQSSHICVCVHEHVHVHVYVQCICIMYT